MGAISYFERGHALYPDRTFLIDDAGATTYRESGNRIRRIAAALKESGCGEDDKIAIISANSALAFEYMLAIYAMGAVFVSVNAGTNLSEKLALLNGCDATVICYQQAFGEEIESLRGHCGVRTFIALESWQERSANWTIDDGDVLSPAQIAKVNGRDRLVSLYGSGGTTGVPKGIMFTNRVWDTMSANFLLGIDCSDAVFLMVPPFTHGAGSIAMPLPSLGGTIVIHDGFDAGKILRTIEERKITHLWLPPTAVYMLLDHPELTRHDLSSLRVFLYSAAPMSVSKLQRCLEVFGPVMVQVYGQTEAPLSCTVLDQRDHLIEQNGHPERLKSCGRPTVFTPVEVMDEAGHLLGADEVGELVVRGDLVMAGYYRQAEATAEVMVDGWLRTGDIGYKDIDGYVYIIDRKKQMIISGGYNVYPAEIEQVISAHPAVADCAVIGVPDEKWGEAVKAVVELRCGTEVSATELIAHCRARLSGVKTPKSVDIMHSLPRTSIGKVDKRRLRDSYWKDAGRRI